MSFYIATSDDDNIYDYFSGMAFSNKAIVLSLPGLFDYIKERKKVDELVDGRYSLCVNVEGEHIFATDGAGQDCWYYFSESNFWLVSNSLYAAAKKLKERRNKILLNETAALFYNVNHSLGGQPCNENTMVEGIKILPRDCFIKIQENILNVYYKAPIKKIENEEEYKEKLVEYIGVWRSRLCILSKLLEAGRVRCDISGGIDSRIVMGLTMPSETKSNIKYSSNKSWESDYLVASLLATKYGFNIDNSEISFPRTISVSEAIELYKLGNAGIYKNIYWPKHSKTCPSIHLHGAGGGNISGVGSGSAWKVVHRLKSHFSKMEDFINFKEEYLSWFNKNDIDPKSEASTIYHYRNFRSRFHFGRNCFRSLTNPLVTPLSSLTLESMSDYMIRNGRDPKSVQFDLLYICDSFLPFFPFDKKEKEFGIKIAGASLSYLTNLSPGGFEDKIKVYGQLEELCVKEATGVNDNMIFGRASAEVDDFILNYSNDFSRLFPVINDPSKKLNCFGLISILKLL